MIPPALGLQSLVARIARNQLEARKPTISKCWILQTIYFKHDAQINSQSFTSLNTCTRYNQLSGIIPTEIEKRIPPTLATNMKDQLYLGSNELKEPFRRH
ncbi:hypothetical protein ACMD2_13063 [Ananas comosus]|uniref:Uncharacterized protein n=1 Tax=Ananas comosus TaxID=4615 RepID=A0A199VGU8_ANACO|nr:hypothetical protein ACMD2_13063 [Ananas comosus]